VQRLIFVPQDDSDDEERVQDGKQGDNSGSSSSDENDSTAAAHAAAIGHSPKPIRPTEDIPASDNSKTINVGEQSTADAAAPDKTSAAAGKAGEGISSMDTTSPDGASNPQQQAAGQGQSSTTKDADKLQADEMDTTDNGNGDATGNGQQQETKKKQKFYSPHNLNERDGDENTPLHVAIHARKLEHVKLLLEAGANVHKKSDGSAPIHTAISIASLPQHEQFGYDCLVVLKQMDADLTAKDDAMHTPLYLACKFNLPNIVFFLLSDEAGLSTLNTKADRSGGRPLHIAAKFDTHSNPFGSRAASGVSAARAVSHHHPDGSVVNSMHHLPGVVTESSAGKQGPQATPAPTGEAALTQLLLRMDGIEVDALNTVGQTPLHIACLRGNWVVARLLLQAKADPTIADRRGFTPGQLAHKRGMPIPLDLIGSLGGPPSSGTVAPPRDLIVDPDLNTLLISHELCVLHRSCVPITRDAHEEPPPENVRRLTVLIDQDTGILRGGEFSRIVWEGEARRAAMVDVLKVRSSEVLTARVFA